jgi:hypothetical protein
MLGIYVMYYKASKMFCVHFEKIKMAESECWMWLLL